MRAIDKVTTSIIGVASGITLLATIIMFVGLVGVIFKVYDANFFLSNVAIFKTLTIDRFIMLLVWLVWSALVSSFGIAFLREIRRGIQPNPFYALTVLLGILPYLTALLYVLFTNQCLWFGVMIIWVGILYFMANRIISIIRSYRSIYRFCQSFSSQSTTIRVLEVCTIVFALVSIALPFI